jgi:hypothetical protein
VKEEDIRYQRSEIRKRGWRCGGKRKAKHRDNRGAAEVAEEGEKAYTEVTPTGSG